ncbi:uncharacterized protein LOC131994307 isoform X1 [Stomoxys calcitrans]|uniref:uncharacterized protein LOC131994307 isoform X1 n=1 Tax=Stomoxys calcitrans TaxID=35570 RepID=UPI0027E33171|nr:uncharacterized protein LOC131994307 isoform X1 [Stomoxys calcitrans]
MSDNQTKKRTSGRNTQGIPPARFDSEIYDMSLTHSPKAKTPSHNPQNEPLNAASTSTPPANLNNVNSSSSSQHQKTPVNSQASVPKPANEIIELKKHVNAQMQQMQRQMQAIQTEILASTQQMQNTAKQMQEQFANLQSLSAMPSLISLLQQTQSQTPQLHVSHNPPSSHLPTSETQEPLNSPDRTSYHQPPPGSSITSDMSVHSSHSQNSLHLPQKKIYPLPTFTGLPEEWQTFYESFESTTTEFGYSNLHNIMRLRDSLKGRAKESVESLLGNSSKVAAILELLQETFGRPEQLIRSQIEKVRSVSPIANDNLEALVNYANKICNMATFLKNAKGEHHLTNPSLLSELVSKLSTNRQMQWAEKCLQLQEPATIVDFANRLSTLRRLANMVNDTLPIASTSANRRHVPTTTSQTSTRKFACVGVSSGHQCPVCNGECKGIKNCPTFLQMSLDDRWSKVKQIKTCFSCLKRGHQVKNCHQKGRCGVNGCQKPHHSLLHKTFPALESSSAVLSQPNMNTDAITQQTESQLDARRNCHATCHTENVLFQILPITIYGKQKQLTIYAFVDDGANVSMLHTDIANELNIHGERDFLELQWLNNHRTSQNTEKINITISGIGHYKDKYTISNIYLSADLSLPVQSCHMAHFLKSQECEKISKFPVHDYSNVRPMMILSLQHSFLTVPLEVPRLISEFGPIVTITRLGAILYGPIPGDKNNTNKHVLHFRRCSKTENNLLEDMNNMMRGYFDVETLGIKVYTKPLISKKNERAMQLLNKATKWVNGRYECPLLWKENVPLIPESYDMALRRLYSIEQKMAKNREYGIEYKAKIDDYIKKGYCRKLTTEEKEAKYDRVFYIPHFGVKNPNKKGIRLVFDAAAEINEFSLNKALISGPDLNNPLISILFKLREGPIAVCGDIKEMFHQIGVTKMDQNCQRFLWRNGDVNSPVDIYVMELLIFGATCSPTIAQFVKNLNAKKFLDTLPRAVRGITDRHYVDDYVHCFQSEEDAVKILKEVIKIHKVAGFHLHGIKSNSKKVLDECGNPDGDKGSSGNTFCYDGVERILGIRWVPATDVFCFDLKLNKVDGRILRGKKIPTKREMLCLNMSIYDPFGFVSDFMVTSKIIMQSVWKSGIQWDEELPKEIYGRWKFWLAQLPNIVKFNVPRYYNPTYHNNDVELHIFTDASEDAMAAVGYWRVILQRCCSGSGPTTGCTNNTWQIEWRKF